MDNLKAMQEQELLDAGLNIHQAFSNDGYIPMLIRSKSVEDKLMEIFGTEDMFLIDAMIIEEAVERGITPAERQGEIIDYLHDFDDCYDIKRGNAYC